MAAKVFADHIENASESHLEHLPGHILLSVWEYLERRGLSLHAWKLLSRRLLADSRTGTLGMHRFHQEIRRPSPELSLYLSHLTSRSFDFITHLCICAPCPFRDADLLLLSQVRNLGVLEIIGPGDRGAGPFPAVTDRLVRAWSLQPGAFPILRLLRVWGHQAVTERSLPYVSRFPSLAVYDVGAPGSDWEDAHALASGHGWQVKEGRFQAARSVAATASLFQTDGACQSSTADEGHLLDAALDDLYHNSKHPVNVVPRSKAPTCHEACALLQWQVPSSTTNMAPEKTTIRAAADIRGWHFWVFALLGQLWGNQDVESQGVPGESVTVAEGFVEGSPVSLPPRPMASLHIGNDPADIFRGRPYICAGVRITSRLTFYRPYEGIRRADQPASDATGTRHGQDASPGALHPRKRQKLGEVLSSFQKGR